MNFRKLLFIFGGCALAGLSLQSSCNSSDCEATEPNPNCVCYEIYAPVCGCDNVTYSNDCYAECHGISEYTEGECD